MPGAGTCKVLDTTRRGIRLRRLALNAVTTFSDRTICTKVHLNTERFRARARLICRPPLSPAPAGSIWEARGTEEVWRHPHRDLNRTSPMFSPQFLLFLASEEVHETE